MAEYIDVKQLKERPKLNFYKSLYLFWFLGIIFCFIVIQVYNNLIVKDWFDAFLWFASLILVIPPYNIKQMTSILRSWEEFLK